MQYEAAIVLRNDDSAAWDFVDFCRRRLIRKYKYNMSIIRDIEKAAFGKNSYFRLLECGLYREPQFEGDYSGEAPQSEVDDEEDAPVCAKISPKHQNFMWLPELVGHASLFIVPQFKCTFTTPLSLHASSRLARLGIVVTCTTYPYSPILMYINSP